MPTLRILHISDLHERVALPWMSEERRARIRRGIPTRHRVLAENFEEILHDIAAERPVDLVCFTGDLADWGLAEEYHPAEKRLDRLLKAVNVPRERLFLVPGNHDVHRGTEEPAWKEIRKLWRVNPDGVSAWMAGDATPYGADPAWRDAILKRTTSFWAWAGGFGRSQLIPAAGRHERLGYCVKLPHVTLPIFILGLDSAWLAGDDSDTGKLGLTRDQVLQCATDPETGSPLQGFRIALLHHPLGDLSDGNESRRLLGDHVDLLLNGHQHEAQALDANDPDRTLHTLAAGSLYAGDQGDHWVNSFHVIDTTLSETQPLRHDVTFYAWSPNGFWHRDSALYRNAPDGRLTWSVPLGRPVNSREQHAHRERTANANYLDQPAKPSRKPPTQRRTWHRILPFAAVLLTLGIWFYRTPQGRQPSTTPLTAASGAHSASSTASPALKPSLTPTPLTKRPAARSPTRHQYLSWERVIADLQAAHAQELVVDIQRLGEIQFAPEPHAPAARNGSGWQREPIERDGSYCRQLAWITMQDSAGNRTCHVEAALYVRLRGVWKFETAVRGDEGCSD